jgi:hypothetical protein
MKYLINISTFKLKIGSLRYPTFILPFNAGFTALYEPLILPCPKL